MTLRTFEQATRPSSTPALCVLVLAGCAAGSAMIRAPDVLLLDQSGGRTSLAGLRGRVVVVTFLYTHCTDTCPLQLAKIQRALDGMSDDIAVAVITVDPERDTPDRLAAYATHWPVQWRFLTEAHAVISRVWKAYGIVVAKQETNARDALTGARGYDVIHSARAVVLNRDGFTAADLRGDWEAPALQRALESVLANRPVEGGNVRSRLISDIFSRCGEWASKHPWAFSALLLLAMLPGLAIPAYVLRILLRPGRAPEDARR